MVRLPSPWYNKCWGNDHATAKAWGSNRLQRRSIASRSRASSWHSTGGTHLQCSQKKSELASPALKELSCLQHDRTWLFESLMFLSRPPKNFFSASWASWATGAEWRRLGASKCKRPQPSIYIYNKRYLRSTSIKTERAILWRLSNPARLKRIYESIIKLSTMVLLGNSSLLSIW